MKLQEIIKTIEDYAPPALQESYDNSGLMVGEPDMQVTGALLTLDITEDIIREAIQKGCNLIVAHHPIWFQPRKRLNGEDFVSRCILLAIRNHIALYSVHTNLDNVHTGVNKVIADRLGLRSTHILSPRPGTLCKFTTYVPEAHKESLLEALFAAGAGHIGEYDECSFSTQGEGSYRPSAQAQPFEGQANIRSLVSEVKIELVFPHWLEKRVIQALFSAHPYEEVAYQVIKTENSIQQMGSGLIGEFTAPIPKMEFLQKVKETFDCGGIRYADSGHTHIQKIAICGGAGAFLIPHALRKGADAFLTADITYHKFFEAEGRMLLMDIGHFESEQFTPLLLNTILSEKFPNFALHLSEIRTNPVHYY